MILSYNDKEEHYQQLIVNEYNADNLMKNKAENNKNKQMNNSYKITGNDKNYRTSQETIELIGKSENKKTENN